MPTKIDAGWMITCQHVLLLVIHNNEYPVLSFINAAPSWKVPLDELVYIYITGLFVCLFCIIQISLIGIIFLIATTYATWIWHGDTHFSVLFLPANTASDSTDNRRSCAPNGPNSELCPRPNWCTCSMNIDLVSSGVDKWQTYHSWTSATLYTIQ